MINPTTDRIIDSARIAWLRNHGYVVDDMLTIMNPVTRHEHKVNVYSAEGMEYVRRKVR